MTEQGQSNARQENQERQQADHPTLGQRIEVQAVGMRGEK